ncbi:MAG: hypothetical protein KF773_13445 [Deltaproteobacteria bacterium]|nr:hypothetical protein [Deltaproteobacteria bacterium]MCW5803365.1 hypothetical protein [Deltaproteobacteria bacterium]
MPAGDDRERAIAEIAAAGRATRKPASRALWIAAAIAGALGLAGFAIAMLADGSTTTTPSRSPEVRSLSFGTGLAVGVVAGLILGYVLFRHSSRRRP